mmetsp:Transcript_9826/g.21860  ORF Transcript_9826/g.21860 Transcript_9826/m.21860 type:complete len:325 (-) Transcript_9826:163-1137(-)
MDVVLTVGGQVKVNHKRNLLHINTTGQKIGGDENAGRSRTELTHDDITFTLVHISMHARDGEVTLLHLLLQPIDLATGVAVDNGLGDGESLVQITKSVELPLLPLHSNVELLDTLKGQLILLDEDPDRIPHETLSDLQHIQGHGSREKAHLHRFRKELKNIINLILEPTRKHLISLIQKELPDAIQPQSPPVNHIINTPRSSNHNMHSSLKSTNVITDGGTSDAGMDLEFHVVSEGNNDLLDLLGELTSGCEDEGLAFAEFGVKFGEGSDGEGGGFTRSRLSLSNQIPSQHGRLNSPLLNSTRLLKSIGVDPPQEFFGDLHAVE